MDLSKEFFACLALRHTPGLGPRTWKKILSVYDSVYAALRDVRQWSGQRLARKDQVEAAEREVWRADAEVEYRAAMSRRMTVITWFDSRFPQRLREIPDPPLLLYASGDAALLSGPCVAVVGARKCTRHGLDAASRVSTELSRMGLTVVSGLALGVDREAHLGGLAGVGSSVAVLGCGLDVQYPKGNGDLRAALEERGCIVSEFAPGTPPDGNNFPHRNRIISGLSMAVVVVEAAQRSGSLITARLAGEQGREVFALPGPAGQAAFSGGHSLIRDGAILAESGEDVLRELRWQLGPELDGLPRPSKSVSSEPIPGRQGSVEVLPHAHISEAVESRPSSILIPVPQAIPAPNKEEDPKGHEVWQRLGQERVHIDELTRELGWESALVSQTLLLLEMSGVVRQWPGMRYSRV